MGHVLICTIGNRDVVLRDQERWPPQLRDLQPGEGRQLPGARERGAYLASHLAELRDSIELPIMSKALSFVEERTDKLDALLLVVSDQDPTTRDEHRAKDTIEFGNLIKEYLPQHPKWGKLINKKQIRLVKVGDNPADFDNMRDFFEHELANIKRFHGADNNYYLALSGGTPAMTAMLLFVGSAVFGRTCLPLYISDAISMAIPLEASQQIYRQSVRHAMMVAISGYNYATAAKLLRDNAGEPVRIVDSEAGQKVIVTLLDYAHQRLAFDFEAARQTISQVVPLQRGALREQIVQLWDQTKQLADNDERKLLEVYFGADIKYGNGEYADLLGRIFRFHEGMLKFVALRWGARFDASEKNLDIGWVTGETDLLQWFATFQYGSHTGIDWQSGVTRPVLLALDSYLARHAPDKQRVIDEISSIEQLAGIRNKTIIAHNFMGVSKKVLAEAFTGVNGAKPEEADRIVPTLRAIYEAVTAQPVGPNPFSQINELLQMLLREES